MPILIDSYSEANADSGEGSLQFGGTLKLGQSFTGNGRVLDSAKFYIRKAGSPPGTIVAEVYAHSGTFGTSSIGTGSPLAVSDAITATDLPSSLGLVEFVFSGANRITLADGTHYVVMVSYSDAGSNGSNNIRIVWDESSPTHNGNFVYYSVGTSWGANSTRDLPFYVYIDSTLSKTVSDIASITDTITRGMSRTILETASSAIMLVASVALLIQGKTRSPIIASVKNYLRRGSRISDL